jgi:hypothetical protein
MSESISERGEVCKIQVLQLEVSNDHQVSDKIDLGMHFHHRTNVRRSCCACCNSHDILEERAGVRAAHDRASLKFGVAGTRRLKEGIVW